LCPFCYIIITMKYLFIDFEFSNSNNHEPKICEFGYVLVDSNLEIIEEDDILINPGKGGAFQTGVGFPYAHPMKDYYKAPLYPMRYDFIKNLLLERDTVIIGFSIDSDIDSIKVQNKRYNLPDYHIKGYDIQRYLDEYKKEARKVSLEKKFNEMAYEEDLMGIRAHNPEDDAYMTFKIFQYSMEDSGKNIDEFMKDLEDTLYDSNEGYIHK